MRMRIEEIITVCENKCKDVPELLMQFIVLTTGVVLGMLGSFLCYIFVSYMTFCEPF